MNDLHDIIWALLDSRKGVKLPRLIKEVYLVDWKCAFAYPPRPCKFAWVYGPCGPTSNEILKCIQQHSNLFRIEERQNSAGIQVQTIFKREVEHSASLSMGVPLAIDLVLRVAAPKDWEALSLLVSSTYPIMRSSMLDELELERFAEEYREVLRNRNPSNG